MQDTRITDWLEENGETVIQVAETVFRAFDCSVTRIGEGSQVVLKIERPGWLYGRNCSYAMMQTLIQCACVDGRDEPLQFDPFLSDIAYSKKKIQAVIQTKCVAMITFMVGGAELFKQFVEKSGCDTGNIAEWEHKGRLNGGGLSLS